MSRWNGLESLNFSNTCLYDIEKGIYSPSRFSLSGNEPFYEVLSGAKKGKTWNLLVQFRHLSPSTKMGDQNQLEVLTGSVGDHAGLWGMSVRTH